MHTATDEAIDAVSAAAPAAGAPLPRGLRVARVLAGGAGALPLALALLSMTGYALPALRAQLPAALVMQPAAALVVTLLSLALLLVNGDPLPRWRIDGARIGALLAAACAALAVVAGSVDRPVDADLLPAATLRGPFDHLWSVPSGAALALAAALALVKRPGVRCGRAAAALAIAGGLIGVLILLGYVLDAATLYNARSPARVAPVGALALTLLALGVLASEPRRGPTSLLLADDAGGASLRRLLPTVAALVILLVVARRGIENLGLLRPSTSAGIFAALAVLLFSSVLFVDALWLSRLNRRQRRAEFRLARLAADLERQVAARTGELAEANASLEAQMRERGHAEALFRGVLEAVPDAVLVVDDDGRIELANRRCEALLGHAREDLLGKPVSHLVPAAVMDVYRERWRAFLANPAPHRLFGEAGDLAVHRTDGGELPVEIALGAFLTDGHRRIIVSIRDIEPRITAQRQAREADQRFRLLVDNLPIGIFVSDDDPDGRLLEANPAMLRILEADSMQQLLGSAVSSFHVARGERAALLAEANRHGGLGGAAFAGVTLRGRRFEGALTIAPRHTDQGLVWDGVLEDVTDRQQAQQRIVELNRALSARAVELETTNRELEAFSYSVSHDLRAPLRAIDGFSRILEQECAAQLDAANIDRLARVRRNAQHMGALIDDLLGLARVTRAELHWGTVDLGVLALEVLTALADAQPQRKVQIDVAPDLLARGDLRLLRIAMQNLLDNAWKFTAHTAAARIGVYAEQQDGQRVFAVRDNGAGFDMAYADKLFGAFQRLHRMDEFTGTGVGLATVQRIIHKHGGRIWAQAAPQRGATFYFTLTGDDTDGGPDHPAG
jgi:PAS domain S-box-containing protein